MKILIVSAAVSACARAVPPAPRPVMVNVPIATPIYCDVPALPAPPLAIASLTADSPPADTIRDYAATVEVLKSAVRERDAILKGCEAPEELNPRLPSPGGRGAKTKNETPKNEKGPALAALPTQKSAILFPFPLGKGLGVRSRGSGTVLKRQSPKNERAQRAVKKPEPASRGAKLSEILPAARVARFVRMTVERAKRCALYKVPHPRRCGATSPDRERDWVIT